MKRGVSTAEEKTVGEILEKEGIIKDRPKEEVEEIKHEVKEEVDLKELVMRVEKLAAEVTALKEIKFHADERIREISEKIGELRSLVFQRETSIKEMESKIKLLDDVVSDVEPKKIGKEMEKRKGEIEEVGVKIERLETMNKGIVKDLRGIEKITGNIKSVENLREMLDRIEEMVGKGEKTRSDMDRLAGKAERFYIEMENRIKEFPEFKIKLEKIDGLTKEVAKTIDEINIKLAGFTPKEDLESFKKRIDDVIFSNREKLEGRLREIEEILKVPSEEIISRRSKLKSKRDNISKLLTHLEEQYRGAAITQKAYNEIKEKNESLLKRLDEEIKKLEGEEVFSLKSLPSIVNELESGLSILDLKTTKLENKIKEISEAPRTEEFAKRAKVTELEAGIKTLTEYLQEPRPVERGEINTTLKAQIEVAKNMLEKIREVNEKVTKLSKAINNFDLKVRFFEILNMLIRMETANDISFYISELEKTISEMKSKNLWDNKKDLLAKNLLEDIAEAWNQYGYDDIVQIFIEGIKKISSAPVIETVEPETGETEADKPEKHEYMLTY